MRLTLPSVFGIDVEEAENPVHQIAELEHKRDGNLVPFTSGRITGFLFRPGEPDEVLILHNAKNVRAGYPRVLNKLVGNAAAPSRIERRRVTANDPGNEPPLPRIVEDSHRAARPLQNSSDARAAGAVERYRHLSH